MTATMTGETRKTALVTGAARRIGREIALALADSGWDVAVHYRHSESDALATVRDIRVKGRQADAIYCDLSSEDETNELLSRATAKLGPISCVVNNASIFEHDNVAEFAAGNLDYHMRINLSAPILLTRALHRMTPEGAQSVVVNLLDQKVDNLNPSFLSYTLSKAALKTATTLLAQELAPKLRVVGVAPGITLVSADQTHAEFELAHKITPLGRSSTPQDIASAVCFLVNAPAITGTTLTVDGGQHLLPLPQDVMFVVKTQSQNPK